MGRQREPAEELQTVFVDGLDLCAMEFSGIGPAKTGRPAYHPAVLLKIYLYGYLNRIQSSRRLERETQRNVELTWLTGRLTPDCKTIADFRKDNGAAIRNVCPQFIVLCRELELLSEAIVAIDGSKFKAVNNRDKNLTSAKMKRRLAQIEDSIARYLTAMDTGCSIVELCRQSSKTALKRNLAPRNRLHITRFERLTIESRRLCGGWLLCIGSC